MSYILDALRKAERERKLGNVPTIDATLDAAGRSSRSSRWPTIIAVALVANATVLGALYLYWQHNPETAAARTGAEIETLSAPAVPQAEAVVPLDPVSAPLPTRPLQTAAVDDRQLGAAERQAVPLAPAEPLAAANQDTTPDPVPEPLELAPALPPSQPAEVPVPLKPARTITQVEASPPPLLEDLPAAYRRTVPPMDLTVHVYSDTPSQRFVFLNNRRYGEGQDTEEGARIERIQPRGTVLSFQGKQFFLPGRW